MKIGILTYHLTHNYGGCLQALALRIALESLGHEVYYVDYWPKYHQRKYSAFNIDEFNGLGLRGKAGYLLRTLRHYPFFSKRKENFERFHNTYTYPYCKPTSEAYDVIVYGSDQIWRKQSHSHQYNPVYFGDNDFKARLHVSYAASMGVLPTKQVDVKVVVQLVSHLYRIGVRELDLKDFLSEQGVSDVNLTIDPTLLLDSETWNKIVPLEPYTGKPYILVYALWGEVFDMKSIYQFAKQHDMIVKILRGRPTHKDTETEITTAGPEEFLRLIKSASFVFSSSFHGLVFSILHHKSFYTSFSKNGGRARSLLSTIGLSDRYLEPLQPITQIMFDTEIDYSEVEKHLSESKFSSLNYLHSIHI